MRKKALVVLAEGFEELEALTPVDVLRRAGIEVVMAGLKSKVIKASRRVGVEADILLDDYEGLPDVLIIPGGFGAQNLAKSNQVIKLIQDAFEADKIVASICASPAVVLSKTGVLENKKVTCYPGYEKEFPDGANYLQEKIVIDGNLITSRGPGTAFDFALTILEKLTDFETAKDLGAKMLYDFESVES